MFAEPGKLVSSAERAPPASAGLGNRCRWRHRLAASNRRGDGASTSRSARSISWQALPAVGGAPLQAILAHTAKWQNRHRRGYGAAVRRAARAPVEGAPTISQYRNMFRIATRNAVQRARFADAVSGQQRTAPLMRASAVSGICRIQLVARSRPAQGAVRDDAIGS